MAQQQKNKYEQDRYEKPNPTKKRKGRLETGLMAIEDKIDSLLFNFKPTYEGDTVGIEYKWKF
jgi:hypothetical protein